MKRFYIKWDSVDERREAAPCELLKDGYFASGNFLFKVPKEKLGVPEFWVHIDCIHGCIATVELFSDDDEMSLEKVENLLRLHVKERLQYFLEKIK